MTAGARSPARPTTAKIALRCRAHNAYEADEFYGRLFNEREPTV